MKIGKNTPTRILIADDRPEVRSALRFLLENETGNWKITGEAANTADLHSAILQDAADLVLLDWELPGYNTQEREAGCLTAVDLVKLVRQNCVSLLIIAISGMAEARQQAQAAGVDGFVSKCESPDTLLSVFKRVEARL